MNPWIRRGAIAATLSTLAAAGTVLLGEHLAQERGQRRLSIDVAPVAWRTDTATLERGRYLYTARGCVDCHGDDGGGRTLVNDGKGMHVAGPNLSPGNPALARYTGADWVRSIRHGVGPDGRPLRVMPSLDYARMSDEDLAAVVAHLQQLPARTGNERPVLEFPLPVRLLYGFGLLPDAADRIDHRRPPTAAVHEAATADYGHYVAQTCLGCHGATLDGGRIPGGPPDWPAASRLSPGADSAMPRYADADSFKRMFRTGLRPDGSRIAVMPFESLGQMNDTELQALYLYLKSLRPAG